MRPLTKDQFDAIQSLKGKIKDVGVISAPNCFECQMFKEYIELDLHSADVNIYGDDMYDINVGTGIFVFLPDSANLDEHPLVKALRDAQVSPFSLHHPEQSGISKRIRTDIPVIFVGERAPTMLSAPYMPTGALGFTILPLTKP